jgi:hypothetical protein
VRVDNTSKEKVANLDHFLAFIAGSPKYNNSYLEFIADTANSNSSVNDRLHNCSVTSSWLAAMDYVYHQLQTKELDARIGKCSDVEWCVARCGVARC